MSTSTFAPRRRSPAPATNDLRYTAALAQRWASDPGSWHHNVRRVTTGRWYAPLFSGARACGWVIAWAPGSSLAWHDHGEAAGSIVVVEGRLTERYLTRGSGFPARRRELSVGPPISFGPDHLHEVRNEGDGLAVSIHVYAPRLEGMTFYAPSHEGALTDRHDGVRDGAERLDRLLTQTRAGLHRLTPRQAATAIEHGALLIDIRSDRRRRVDGELPGAIIIDRNVLEWRLTPAAPHQIPELTSPDQTVILACSEGYASSLAAATLRELGLSGATDLAGGFRAWMAHGLPTAAYGHGGCVDRTEPVP